MEKSFSESYKAAGVDVTAGYKAVELMKKHVARTITPGVVSDIGGIGGLFAPDISGMKEPVLVSGTDGVGTKLKLAFFSGKNDTVGIDCVAMCANDVVCCGAKPIFFLDYLAVGKNHPEQVAEIVSGVAEGCVQAGCALIGGETAEMPNFYPDGEYDLAGFCVGIVDKSKIFDNSKTAAGDVVIGIASSGVHSNGFSLVRKIFPVTSEIMNAYSDLLGAPLWETLLTPTKIYVKSILALAQKIDIKSVSHITGGGFYENIPRSLPEGKKIVIDRDSLDIPPIFSLIKAKGDVPERDMFNTFNMGYGMCVVVPSSQADEAVGILRSLGEKASVIGYVADGEKGVEIR